MSDTVLKLPVPPSTNNLFANKRKGGRFVTEAYKAWKNEAGWMINAQHPHPVIGPVALEYEFQDGSTKADIGNLEKAVSDLLVTHRLIQDDNPQIVRSITLRWSDLIEGVKVTIRPAVQVPF